MTDAIDTCNSYRWIWDIDKLSIPFKVEIVDLSMVSEDFKQATLREAVVWKK
jgi:hypothetical protein